MSDGSGSTWLQDQLARAAEIVSELDLGMRAELGRPAADQQIDACEQVIGTPLAATHRDFLKLHDGAYFAIFPRGDDADWSPGQRGVAKDVWIYSCAEIATATMAKREFLRDFFSGIVPDPPLSSAIVVARYDGCGDICLADPQHAANGEYPILDGFNETPDTWVNDIIAPSFREWLERMFTAVIDKRMLPHYWLPTSLHMIVPEA